MKILVVGGGGREHAILTALKKSPRVTELHAAPGNGGISRIAQCHDVSAADIPGMVKLAKELEADYVFVAPDDPLVLGMVDALEAAGIKSFGPRKNAAVLEGSKAFSKEFMKRHGIPTAAYEIFDDYERACAYLAGCNYPVYIKSDGLALGKGAVFAGDVDEAKRIAGEMMVGMRFGESGRRIVVEEFMTGVEVTVLAFTDGVTVRPMLASTDHKCAHDGDTGLNTGGMGVIAPTPYYTPEKRAESLRTVIEPTIGAMAAEGRPFKGCIYFGLMLTESGVKVVEYNCRFGDPEAQALLPLLKTDLVEIMEAVHEERLSDLELEWEDGAAACVVMASGGYPEKYEVGKPITGLDDVAGALVFHAGTRAENGELYTAGGRVLGVVGTGGELSEALENAYAAVGKIGFEGGFYRTDIGRKALSVRG